METYRHGAITDLILCCFYSVYNKLGFGFLERIYENSLLLELRKRGLSAQAQAPVSVFYDGVNVGEYYIDLFVENLVVVELKTVKNLMPEHEAQLVNYLKATRKEVGLLLNFGPEPQVRRKVFTH